VEHAFDAARAATETVTGTRLTAVGLFIGRKGVEACGGLLRVRDMPGVGCVFSIDLPRISHL
jgi:signal transduction histidine kinase